MKPNQNAKWINVYIYSFIRHFYPKCLTNEALCNPGAQKHDHRYILVQFTAYSGQDLPT